MISFFFLIGEHLLILKFYFIVFNFIFIMYFWLQLVLVAACGLSLVAAGRPTLAAVHRLLTAVASPAVQLSFSGGLQ